jgi:hypothetical protein
MLIILPTYTHEQYWSDVSLYEYSYFAFTRALPPVVEMPWENINSLTATYARLTYYLTAEEMMQSTPLREDERTKLLEAYENVPPHEEDIDPGMLFRPTEREEGYGFVSYAHDDIDAVMPIIQDVFALGYDLWWDEGIPGAWLRHLDEKVKLSKYFLLFLSRRAATSEFIRKELKFARQYGKTDSYHQT